jgi:hypothetical protein
VELILGGIALAVYIIAWLHEKATAPERERKEAERKRPVEYCASCGKPSKDLGGEIVKNYLHTVGSGEQSRRICDSCARGRTFCDKCGMANNTLYSTWSNGRLCKGCFESTPRNFKDTREAAKRYHGSWCAICGSARNLEVHHKTYARKGCERFTDLVVLCRSCHVKQHTTVYIGPRGGRYIKRNGRKIRVSKDDVAYSRSPEVEG